MAVRLFHVNSRRQLSAGAGTHDPGLRAPADRIRRTPAESSAPGGTDSATVPALTHIASFCTRFTQGFTLFANAARRPPFFQPILDNAGHP
jgi:hypothetical protein